MQHGTGKQTRRQQQKPSENSHGRAGEHASAGTVVRRRSVHARAGKYLRVRLGARVLTRVGGQAEQDGTGQQLRSGKMAGIWLQHAMAGARHADRERSKPLLVLESGRRCMHRRPQLLNARWPGWCLPYPCWQNSHQKFRRAVHVVVACKRPKGQLRRQPPEPSPLGSFGLLSEQPAHSAKKSPFPPFPPIPESTLISQAPLVGVPVQDGLVALAHWWQ